MSKKRAKKFPKSSPLCEPYHWQLLGNRIVGFENVGGDIDKVTGKRVTIAAFPWRWVKGTGYKCRPCREGQADGQRV